MRVCAFDIGFKNFAYVCIDFTNFKWNLIKMDCVDLKNTNCVKVLFDYLKNQFPLSEYSGDTVILIEKQMKWNYQAVRIASYVYAYFHLLHPDLVIEEYSSVHKTKAFDKKKMTKYQRKRWSTQQMLRILQIDDDVVSQEWLSCFPKKDDISDCFLMIITFLSSKHNLDLTKLA